MREPQQFPRPDCERPFTIQIEIKKTEKGRKRKKGAAPIIPLNYVCENYNCKFPMSDVKKFEELLD